MIARSEVVVPGKLSPEARESLIDALYKIQREVFDGVDREAFARCVVVSKAERTWILVHRDRAGTVVGYCALHVFEREMGGKPVAIFRAQAATARSCRGANVDVRLGVLRGLRYLLANRGRRAYFLWPLVHPSSHSIFAKYFPVVFSSARTALPRELMKLMDQVADELGLARVDPANPLIQEMGRRTRDRLAERSFVETDRGDSEGPGLLTLVPVTCAALMAMGCRVVGERLARVRDALLARWSRQWQILHQLRKVPLLSDVAWATVEKLASACRLEVWPSGSTLLRQGEPAGDALVLARGAAYVLEERDGKQRILDEIGSGTMVGELGALSAEPRTASVRTASSSMVVRIPRQALLDAMDSDAFLRERLWRMFAERRLEGHLRAHPHFQHLGHDQMQARLRKVREYQFQARREAHFDRGGYLFLATGAALLEQDGALISTRAPTLIELRCPIKVVPQGDVQALVVPAVH